MRRDLDRLTDERWDLLILGGGITGAGVALDAASRGLRVALIDKGDFASGTSSVSSKLIHGGLRYLEHGDFRLVYEALHERGLLLKNAPHLVRPLRFLLPFYRQRVAPWKWRVGLTLYDLLAGKHNIRRSRPITSKGFLREVPSLRMPPLHGGAEYFDAQMDDARLCIEVLRTAWAHGARLANYVEAVAFEKRGGQIEAVHAVDRISGREMILRARVVLNASGPWGDDVRKLAGDADGPHLEPTKGVHVLVADQGLPAAFLLLHPRDGRVFFVLPWMGKTMLGTTDTFATAGPDDLTVDAEEIRYLLDGINHFFDRSLDPSEVLGSFAGLRPLLRARRGEPSSRSREFRLDWSSSGLLSVAGGKYTTYRSMAEQITDAIAARLGRRLRCQTRDLPLDGTPDEPWDIFAEEAVRKLGQSHGLDEVDARHLVNRYGRRAFDVAGYLNADASLRLPVHADEPDLMAEWAYQRDHEMAMFPADHLLRRMRLGLYRPALLSVGLSKREPLLGPAA